MNSPKEENIEEQTTSKEPESESVEGEDDILDEMDKKKPKQSAEDKRRRNYIAVRKHRQQLKDTLEKCPIELVELRKELEELTIAEEQEENKLSGLAELVEKCQERMPKRKRLHIPPAPPAFRFPRRLSDSPEEALPRENPFRRPKGIFPGGIPQSMLQQTPITVSPVFQSPLFQQQLVSPTMFPGFMPNIMLSPFMHPQFVNFVQSTPGTPMPSPVQFQPMVAVPPEMLQGMMSPDLLQAAHVRTAPIQFTQDNVDALWKLYNEQMR